MTPVTIPMPSIRNTPATAATPKHEEETKGDNKFSEIVIKLLMDCDAMPQTRPTMQVIKADRFQ